MSSTGSGVVTTITHDNITTTASAIVSTRHTPKVYTPRSSLTSRDSARKSDHPYREALSPRLAMPLLCYSPIPPAVPLSRVEETDSRAILIPTTCLPSRPLYFQQPHSNVSVQWRGRSWHLSESEPCPKEPIGREQICHRVEQSHLCLVGSRLRSG